MKTTRVQALRAAELMALFCLQPFVASTGSTAAAQDTLRSGGTALRHIQQRGAEPLPTLLLTGRALSQPTSAVASLQLGAPDDLPATGTLTFVLQSSAPLPPGTQVEVARADDSSKVILTAGEGSAVLDSHRLNVRVTIDLQKLLGTGTGGELIVRAIFPAMAPLVHYEHEPPAMLHVDPDGTETLTQMPTTVDPSRLSAALPLGRLVRVPVVRSIRCGARPGSPCTLQGESLATIQAVAADRQLRYTIVAADPSAPDQLTVPRPVRKQLFLRLKDDPEHVASLTFLH